MEFKADDSLVTVADRTIEAEAREMLLAAFPDHVSLTKNWVRPGARGVSDMIVIPTRWSLLVMSTWSSITICSPMIISLFPWSSRRPVG